jgi:hypothetical protein
MKRLALVSVLALAFVLIAGNTWIYAQGTFKVPFKFKAGGKMLPSGEYMFSLKEDGQIALKKEGGEEILIPFLERLPLPETPFAGPRIVLDVVGNFEPSYTEYVTEYVLAEVWFPGEQGFLIHTTKGAHQTKIIEGQLPAK